MARDLFLMVMEAEGDLVQPFEDTPAPDAEQPQPEQPPPQEPDGTDEPPPLTNDTDLSVNGDGGIDSMPMDDQMQQQDDPNDNEDGTKDGNEKLSDKANAILNQKLYQQLLARNQEIEDILDNLQKVVPLMPYESVKLNDGYVTRLKTALDKGKSYAIEKFVDSEYGENLLFFHKLDALYNLLEDEINRNLKSFNDEDKNNK